MRNRSGFNNLLHTAAPLLCLWLLLGRATPVLAADVDSIDNLVRQWMSLEQQAAALESDWRQQQPVLQQRIALLQAEKAQLAQVLKDNQNVHSEVEARRAELLAEQTGMEAGQRQVVERLRQVRQRLQALAGQLPPPLLSAWNEEQATLNEDATASEQLQVALAQLSKLMEFDNRVTVHETTLPDPEGRRVLVKQLYLGVGAAWFVSGDGSYAGTGGPTPDGWQWRFDEDIDGSRIAEAIAIYEKQHDAELVQMPLHLSARQPGAEDSSTEGEL